MNWRDARGPERTAWFTFHGPVIETEREILRLALERYANNLRACEAYERPYKVSEFVAKVLDAADAFLPEEIKSHLERTTAPRLPLLPDGAIL